MPAATGVHVHVGAGIVGRVGELDEVGGRVEAGRAVAERHWPTVAQMCF